MAKSLLIISRQAPWSGLSAREALDIALAGGAYDLPVGMLFLDDGVFQLSSGQDASQLQHKDLVANLKALAMFGVEDIYACGTSLWDRGIFPDKLNVEPLTLVYDQEMGALMDRYDQVITI
jgi:tRNA 2-thiouridine synthesizing protein C